MTRKKSPAKPGRCRRGARGCRRYLAATAFLTLAAEVAEARQDTASKSTLAQELGEVARAQLAEPALVERVNENPPAGRLARLIEDLHVQFRTFEGADDGDLGLGFSYDFVKALFVSDDASAGAAEIVANGNVGFEQDVNPDDFLWTAVRLRWFGTRALGEGETRANKASNLPDPQGEMLAAFDPERFAELSARFAREPSTAAIRSDPAFQALARSYLASVEHELPPELIWDFDLHTGLESNQDFSSRQVVLGAALGGRLVSWDPDASLSRYNAFDAPAAALRWLAGEDETFRTSGAAYPTVVAGLDLVDAARDEARGPLTDDDSFLRARVEARLESRVLTLDDQALFLSAAWRFYEEIDAPAAVRSADTDASSYLQLSLDLPRGWSLSYTTGRLPLDAEDDSSFALGFRVHF